jgi:LAO/AO transport system kinase
MLLVAEAAGYDVVMVETVGVGQSELAAAAMVDFFLVLMAPAGGDDLQGIKRGILELADAIAVNKADGDLIARARQAQAGYAAALKILAPRDRGWTPQALSVSALSGLGLPELWALIEEQRRTLVEAGIFEERRKEQLRSWMWSLVEDELWGAFRRDPEVQAKLQETEAAVTSARMTPSAGARALVGPFIGEDPGTGSASPASKGS